MPLCQRRIMKDNDRIAQPSVGTGLSRRRLMRGAAALGLAAAASGMFGASAPPARGAAYDAKKYAGTRLNILMTGVENDHRALGDLLPQLEAETGIKLEIAAPALGALIEQTLQNLKAERSSFEIIEYLGFLTTQQVGGGYFERLNSYIDDATETPPDWDFPDFIPAAMRNVGIYDMKAHAVGQGSDVYGIPGLHSGSVIYLYRKDLFDAAGLGSARTWDEFKPSAH